MTCNHTTTLLYKNVSERIKKMWCISIIQYYYSSIKNGEMGDFYLNLK